jgi:hypothetical protein
MSEKKEFSKLTSIKKCPVCNGEIEKGYIQGEVYWKKKKRRLLARVLTTENTMVGPPLWMVPYIPALKCVNCEITIFDYGKGKKRKEP